MRISVAGLALIKRFEGFAPKPYLCPAGRFTIGYGHVMTPMELRTFESIDKAWAENRLINDTRIAEKAVQQFITLPLQQNQLDALVSFTFNLGSGVLQRSTLRQVINRDEQSEVTFQWSRWVWGGGRKLPGLARRRAAELGLYFA